MIRDVKLQDGFTDSTQKGNSVYWVNSAQMTERRRDGLWWFRSSQLEVQTDFLGNSKSVTLYGYCPVTNMASQAAAHMRHLRRLAFTREVQQMAVKVVKYGCAAYCFRTYAMGVTAVSIVLPVCPSRIAGSVSCACLHVMYPCTCQTCRFHTLCSAVHRTKHVPNTEQQGRHPTAAVLAAVLPH